MAKAMVTIAACAILLSVGTLQAATTDEQKCLNGRAKAKGKYEQCVEKWLAKGYAGKGFFQPKLGKCRIKYAAVWSKLQALSGSITCGGVPRFVDNGTTVVDNLTGLIWEKKTTAVGSGGNAADRNDVDNLYTWTTADSDASDEDGTAYTDFLTDLNAGGGFAGANGWRLPTFAELGTLPRPEPFPCAIPCIDPAFGSTQTTNHYWSATSYSSSPSSVWAVSFGFNADPIYSKSDSYYVRAVRGGL